jgi:SAM-dependent methyltransferase
VTSSSPAPAAHPTGPLDPEALDAFARSYYLNDEVATIDLEEMAQLLAVDRIVSAVRGCNRVLEMGFGTGLTTRELLARGVQVELLEGSPVLVEEARRRHTGLVVHEAMFETFAPEQPLDAVLAMHVLEHVDTPAETLAQIRSWLRPGGVLIVVVPNAESLHRRIAVEMGLHANLDDLSASDIMVGHQRVYTLDWLKRDVESAGFDVDLEFGFLLKTVPNSMMLSYPPNMVKALNTISDRVPARDLANIAIRARMI